MKRIFFIAIMILVIVSLFCQTPTAEELLRRVDENEVYDTIVYDGEMIIQHGNRRFVKTMKASARGTTDSFIEFTNPEDRGTKYLKTGGRLMVYSPDTEGVMLISGHMLRESMMGSDLSYEDTMDNATLSSRYTPKLLESETINNRTYYVLELTAKSRTESYPKRMLWIDAENFDLLRYELFALSGAKLKEYEIVKIETIAGRRFPTEVVVKDLLRRNSSTTFIMKNVEMDKHIPNSVFSRRNLER